MWTYEKALVIVRAYVAVSTDDRGVVLENETLDRPYGWVFFYQSRAFIENGDPSEQFGGNAPLIFNRVTGEYHVTGTAYPLEQYLFEYEAALPPFQLELKPQRRARPT